MPIRLKCNVFRFRLLFCNSFSVQFYECVRVCVCVCPLIQFVHRSEESQLHSRAQYIRYCIAYEYILMRRRVNKIYNGKKLSVREPYTHTSKHSSLEEEY